MSNQLEVVKTSGKVKMTKDIKKEQPKVEVKIQPKVVEKEQPKVEIKTQPEVVIDSDVIKLNWSLIQEVATSERIVNGKMLKICHNFYKMFYEDNLQLIEYFDGKLQEQYGNLDNLDLLDKIIYDAEEDKERTLTNAHFDKFAKTVLVYSLGFNTESFKTNNSDEYRVIREVAPVVLWWLANEQHLSYDKNNSPFTDPKDEKTPIRLKVAYEYFEQFGESYEKNRFLQKFYLKSRLNTDYAETFRGEQGVLELAKFSFKSKKEQEDETGTGNSEESPLFKTYKEVCEKLKTNRKFTEGNDGVAPVRRTKEANKVEDIITQAINNLLDSKSNEGYSSVVNHYIALCVILSEHKGIKEWLNRTTKGNKVEFNPRVNGKVFSTEFGDFLKHISIKQA